MTRRTALIIGAGPAGLTLAKELRQRTDITPVLFEASDYVGGISRTVVHNGNRIDIGGHRFFSKSDRVMQWWLDVMPLEKTQGSSAVLSYQNRQRDLSLGEDGPNPDTHDRVMLLRSRKSRIYYDRKFFDYPISLSPDTVMKLGLARTARIGLSYARAAALPISPEENLEQFSINRFGRELYATFFREYTEKVWGTPCDQISAEWGAQRIKGLSITKAVMHFVKQALPRTGSISQKDTETSLIERFLYPKLGPGQMWECVADELREQDVKIHMNTRVTGVKTNGGAVCGVRTVDDTGKEQTVDGDLVFSTMPMNHLVAGLDCSIPPSIRSIADGLQYRDFITVGLLLDDLLVHEADGSKIKDNWIYIQEPGVQVGRMQVFNNWSPYMVTDPGKTWVGLEFFCNAGDSLWTLDDGAMIDLAKRELETIGIARADAARDAVVLRMPKTYPAYFGTYDRFDELRSFLDTIDGLFLLGRNGMHRYNNQDHSMLTAMTAVDNLVAGRTDRSNIWSVNTEQDYHEEKS